MKCLDNMQWPYLVDDHNFITTKRRRKCLKFYLHFFKLNNDQTWKDGCDWMEEQHALASPCDDTDLFTTRSCSKHL